ncbi:hypothetical protein HYU20_00620, partial [Candidatus Woesearchaeota archaeon]|nr:hypothetical protein [Candidatus Woesearchaeota archaeon]
MAEDKKSVEDKLDAHKEGWHVPKWAYVPITLAAAAIIYVSGAAAGYFPNPLSVFRQEQARPAPTVTTKSTDATEANTQRQEKIMLEAAISSELSRLRSFSDLPELATVADTIEATLG